MHWRSANLDILDGSSISLAKVKPEPPKVGAKDKQTSTFDFVKDMLAIVVSAATIVVLANKL